MHISVTYLQFIVLFSVFNPTLPLHLRIYQQWVPTGFCDNDAILDRQVIIWQALQVPLTNLDWNMNQTMRYDVQDKWALCFTIFIPRS